MNNIEAHEISREFVLEQKGRPKGAQHYNGPVYYPVSISHPDFPEIIIQVGGDGCSTIKAMNIARTLFFMAIEEVYKYKIEY